MVLQAIRGMQDVLPPESCKWYYLQKTLVDAAVSFGYAPIRTPIVEYAQVFLRSVGENSDIVSKEVYRFTDKGDNDVCLRPEITASVVRALIQHKALQQHSIHRLFYSGPSFRYERPQKGRQRQFHQFGVECFGIGEVHAELEVLALVEHVWRLLRISDTMSLHLNSLGDASDRRRYVERLVAYLEPYRKDLDADSRCRLVTNPLRIFDSKVATTQAIMGGAPRITDHLSVESRAYQTALEKGLSDLNIPYVLDPQLVRGLDYYNNFVFEYKTTKLGAQDTVCAGGRYDHLTEQFGQKPFPGVGFALGLERLLLLSENSVDACAIPDIYFICISGAAIVKAHQLRFGLLKSHPKMRTVIDYSQNNLRAQIKKANKQRAKFVAILADDELANGSVSIKKMDRNDNTQVQIPQSHLIQYLSEQ